MSESVRAFEKASHAAARGLCMLKHGDARYDPGKPEHRDKWLRRGQAAVAFAEPFIRADERRKVIAELTSFLESDHPYRGDPGDYAQGFRQARFEVRRKVSSLPAPEGQDGRNAIHAGDGAEPQTPQRRRCKTCGDPIPLGVTECFECALTPASAARGDWERLEPARALAAFLVAFRSDRGLTQAQLADGLGWTAELVEQVENAEGLAAPSPVREAAERDAHNGGGRRYLVDRVELPDAEEAPSDATV